MDSGFKVDGKIMENHSIEDWLAARTESTKTEYSYRKNIQNFARFAEERHQNFQDIVLAWRKAKRAGDIAREGFLETWNDIMRSYNTWAKKRYAPLSVKNLLATAKSFFGFWNIPVLVHLPKRACVIYHNKDLTAEEVRQILTFASPRDRVIWLVMVESGMRAGTAINMKYWQIKDDFEADRVPMRILLPSSSLKDHVGDRWSFIGEDGFRELKQYLAQRLPLDHDDFIFASERPGRVEGEQFTVASLSIKFSRLVEKIGLVTRTGKPKRIRMHGLRKYFRNNMRAETGFKKFWMGHSLGVDAHYISRDVEKHREIYEDGYPHLRIYDITGAIVSRKDIEEVVKTRVEDLHAKLKKQDDLISDLKNQISALSMMIDKLVASGGLPDWRTREGGRKLVEHLKKDARAT